MPLEVSILVVIPFQGWPLLTGFERIIIVFAIDPKLREYTSLENMRTLFFEAPKTVGEIAADVIELLCCDKTRWSMKKIASDTGLSKDTVNRMRKHRQTNYDAQTILHYATEIVHRYNTKTNRYTHTQPISHSYRGWVHGKID